jgi:hypothetical protein
VLERQGALKAVGAALSLPSQPSRSFASKVSYSMYVIKGLMQND